MKAQGTTTSVGASDGAMIEAGGGSSEPTPAVTRDEAFLARTIHLHLDSASARACFGVAVARGGCRLCRLVSSLRPYRLVDQHMWQRYCSFRTNLSRKSARFRSSSNRHHKTRIEGQEPASWLWLASMRVGLGLAAPGMISGACEMGSEGSSPGHERLACLSACLSDIRHEEAVLALPKLPYPPPCLH
eukprot:3219879-Rhodomonas_salina.3